MTMMKNTISFLVLCLLPAWTFAQNRVSAQEIINQLNKGEAINYENAEVTGNLDLTQLQNKRLDKNFSNPWPGSHHNYVSTVESSVQFRHCTFRGDVLAYVSEKVENVTYNANFEREVQFEDCVFEKASAFKYTRFEKTVSFQGSTFQDEANFKYSEFGNPPNFSNTRFEGGADFKYVKFPRDADFSGATFRREANFKYAKFSPNANFGRTTFLQFADFKYAEFSEPLQVSGISFQGSEDFKYAEVSGQKLSSYLLNKK